MTESPGSGINACIIEWPFPFDRTACAPNPWAQQQAHIGAFTFNPFSAPRLSDEDVERIAKRVAELIKP